MYEFDRSNIEGGREALEEITVCDYTGPNHTLLSRRGERTRPRSIRIVVLYKVSCDTPSGILNHSSAYQHACELIYAHPLSLSISFGSSGA